MKNQISQVRSQGIQLLVAIVLLLPLGVGVVRAKPAMNEGAGVSQKQCGQNLLADEITRRLRRMGFNYIHSITARPVELVGDVC